MSLLLLLSPVSTGSPAPPESYDLSLHLVFYGAIQFEALEQAPELIIAEVF